MGKQNIQAKEVYWEIIYAWFKLCLGNTFPVIVPLRAFLVFCIQQCHSLLHNRVVRLFVPPTGARQKEAKINLMDCICLAQQAQFSWPGTIIDLEKLKRDKDNNYVMMTLCHKTVDS